MNDAPLRGATLALSLLLAIGVGCRGPEATPESSNRPQPAPSATPAPAGSAASAAAEPGPAIQVLNATLWLQQAAEARALTLQAYALARLRLDQALADPTWTAAEEQTGDVAGLPPAVILDVDETVLDNSCYQTRAMLAGNEFSQRAWTAWCEEARAPAIDGALEFCQYAASRGVTVLYVTNRLEVEKEGTRRNLAALGFPVLDQPDGLLCKQSKSDKGPRRAALAERYRILLLVGDSATDFSSAFSRQDNGARVRIARAATTKWGERWIVLPNPMYGSWADNVVERDPVRDRLAVLRRDP